MGEHSRAIWRKAAVHGALLALVVAAGVTLYDWWLNPGGVFRDASGTSWPAVRETFVSWFLPLLPAGWAVAFGFHLALRLRPRGR